MLDPKGIDYVIPLGPGSQFKNCELRYSLRSLEKYGKGISRVFVVGHDPGFLSSKVIHLKSPVFEVGKEARIAVKIQWAFENSNLSDEILFGNDDYFFTKTFDARTVPFYQRGPLLNSATSVRRPVPPGDTWVPEPHQKLLQATHDALKSANLPAISYELHCPIRYKRSIYCNDLKHWWDLSGKTSMGLGVKSIYGNNLFRVEGQPGPYLHDLKLARYFGEADVAERLGRFQQRFCFSIADQPLYEGFEQWLYDRFPEKSQFEN